MGGEKRSDEDGKSKRSESGDGTRERARPIGIAHATKERTGRVIHVRSRLDGQSLGGE